MNRLKLLVLFLALFPAMLHGQAIRSINIDVKQEKGANNKFFKECVGAGRAHEGLRAEWQNQLRIAREECGFKYIRFHGIFHDDMGAYRVKGGEVVYNWQYIDQLYDFILSIGMKPFVELAYMPNDMASGKQTNFWWKTNVTPPKSMDEYYKFVKAFVQHLSERYGEEEVSTWYFEVWNEPNHRHFFSGKMNDYFEMYEAAANAIKSVSENFRVGGPASAGCEWITEIIEYTDKANLPLDFISSHSYNVNKFFDNDGTRRLYLKKDSLAVAKEVRNTSDIISKSKPGGTEFHITEWSSSYSSRDPVHDTYQNATFILNTLKNTEGSATSMSYWVFTDIFEEAGVPAKPFYGGFGLINIHGIKKPSFFAYKYLNQLGETELVNPDEYSWACKQGDDIQLLVYDFSYPKQGKEPSGIFFTREHKPQDSTMLNISVKNMKNGQYQLLAYKTGYMFNDAYTNYYKLGEPSTLTLNQVEFLKSVTKDEPVLNKLLIINDGSYETSFKLRQNDILFVKLVKL